MQTIRLICHPGCGCSMCSLESTDQLVFLSMDEETQYEFGPQFETTFFEDLADYRARQLREHARRNAHTERAQFWARKRADALS